MEREKLGVVQLLKEGVTLRYYLISDSKGIYGLEVEEEDIDGIISERCPYISTDKKFVAQLGKTIARGIVFPDYLAEIVEDQLG